MMKWMKHPEHGVMQVYTQANVKLNLANDWEFMTEEEVEKQLYPNGRPEPEPEVEDEAVDLESLNYKQLQDLCKEYGVKASGNADELRDRLTEYANSE